MSVKPYIRKVSKSTWYLSRRRDILHMIDETSSLFIGVYVLLLLMGLRALAEDEAAYLNYLEWIEDGSVMFADFDYQNDGEIDESVELADEADEFYRE